MATFERMLIPERAQLVQILFGEYAEFLRMLTQKYAKFGRMPIQIARSLCGYVRMIIPAISCECSSQRTRVRADALDGVRKV